LWVYCLVVAAAVLEAYAHHEQRRSRSYYEKGEHEERYELLQRSLGWDLERKPDPDLASDSCLKVARRLRRSEAEAIYPAHEFYQYNGPSGVGRLLANVGEAAFFTAGQYGHMEARRWRQIAAVGVMVFAAAALAAGLPAESSERQLAIQVLIAILAVVMLRLDLLAEKNAFRDAAVKLKGIEECAHHELGHLRKEGDEELLPRAIELLIEFKSTTVNMPVIPESVYLRVRGGLNSQYQQLRAPAVAAALGASGLSWAPTGPLLRISWWWPHLPVKRIS
jgi:hypothetical protein